MWEYEGTYTFENDEDLIRHFKEIREYECDASEMRFHENQVSMLLRFTNIPEYVRFLTNVCQLDTEEILDEILEAVG